MEIETLPCLFWLTVGLFLDQTLGNIKIGFLPGMTNGGRGKRYAGAFLYAINEANRKYKNLSLSYVYKDNQANTFKSLRAMTWMYVNKTFAFIGPEDTCATEGKLAGAWNIPMIAYKCPDSTDSEMYPTFARTQPSTSKVSKSVIAIMKYFGWTNIALIVGNNTVWLETAETMKDLARHHGISINITRIFSDSYNSTTEMIDIAHTTYQDTRIYLFLGNKYALIDFVRCMHDEMGVLKAGEHVIISVKDQPFNPENPEELKRHFVKIPYEEYTNKTKVQAFRSVLTLTLRPPKDPMYEVFLNYTRDLTDQKFGGVFGIYPFTPPLAVPIHAAYLYDAVAVYTRALNEVLAKGGKANDGKVIFNHIKSRTYQSIQGYQIFVDENGDAEGNYTLLALTRQSSTFPWALKTVGNFTMTQGGLGIPDFHHDDGIEWINGKVPVSVPECGFRGEKCVVEIDYMVVTICSAAAAVIVIAVILVLRHYLYEQKLAKLLWKIDFKDLVLMETQTIKSRHPSSESLNFIGGPRHPSGYSHQNSVVSIISPEEENKNIGIGSYKGMIVSIKFLRKRHVEINRNVKKELQLRKDINHDNINRFLGASIDSPSMCIVTQYCSRGSLEDILDNEDLHLDDMFIASLVFDLIKGMIFLHDSEIISHGNLKSSNCLVDSRWVLQIADFGLYQLTSTSAKLSLVDHEAICRNLLWRAPELLRDTSIPPRGTQKGDVYSFAIILYEIHGRKGPWGDTIMSAKEIIEAVKTQQEKPARPDISWLHLREHGEVPDYIADCITQCWSEDPEQRPDFKLVRNKLKPMQQGLHSNIFDNMLAMMEKYAHHLEELVDERTDQLMEEKKKTELLLLRMLPKSVAEQLKRNQAVIPEHYDQVTIYFSDIVGFTTLSAESKPMEIVDMLNDLYTLCDSITSHYDVYKVETIGDAYMVVSGLPIRNGDNHAGEIASMSLHLLSAIKTYKIKHRPNETLKLRIGMHSGSCVAGVIGLKMPRYCLFGDTVNTASRMESTGVALKIHCSQDCQVILNKLGGYTLEARGVIPVKGKGEMQTYFLTGENQTQRINRLRLGEKEKNINSNKNMTIIKNNNNRPNHFRQRLYTPSMSPKHCNCPGRKCKVRTALAKGESIDEQLSLMESIV